MSERLTPSEVARLDPFGIRKATASSELAEILRKENENKKLLEDWVDNERLDLAEFFDQEIDVPTLPEEVTPEKFLSWFKLQMRLYYLPPIEMSYDKDFPGWKVKLPEEFYQFVQEVELTPEAIKLPGKWVLIDARRKPGNQEGQQLYPDDFLAPVLKKLRHDGKIQNIPRTEIYLDETRFYLARREYEEVLEPEIARLLKVSPTQVRLPRAVEYNFLGNLYYSSWGLSDTWEYLEEYYVSSRVRFSLVGGHYSPQNNGLANIDAIVPFNQGRSNLGFRPLVEF